MEQAAIVSGMTPAQFIRAFVVWGATHLDETQRVVPGATTEMERRIKALSLQILVNPGDLSMRKPGQREVWVVAEAVDPLLARLKQSIEDLLDKGVDTNDLLPGVKQWYRHHAVQVKETRYEALKIPVPHDFAEIVEGAVRLRIFSDGDVDIPLGPRQQKNFFSPGSTVQSLLFNRGNGKKRKMLISALEPKPESPPRRKAPTPIER